MLTAFTCQTVMNYKINRTPEYLLCFMDEIRRLAKIISWTQSTIWHSWRASKVSCVLNLQNHHRMLAHHFFAIEYEGHLLAHDCCKHSWISFAILFSWNRNFAIALENSIRFWPLFSRWPEANSKNKCKEPANWRCKIQKNMSSDKIAFRFEEVHRTDNFSTLPRSCFYFNMILSI